MAAREEGGGGGGGRANPDLLLHPELLSQEFLRLTLEQKNILVENSAKIDKDGLTNLYVQHAIPLPQRDLPKSRWGKMMEKKRELNETKNENKSIHDAHSVERVGDRLLKAFESSSFRAVLDSCLQAQEDNTTSVCILFTFSSVTTVEGLRKRPLIVFDGSSTSTSIKVKKTENGATDRLKPPPAGITADTFRRLSVPSNASAYISASSLSQAAKLETRKNKAKQNSVPVTNSILANLKLPPLTPVAGAAVVKLKRAAPKEESESANDLKPTEAKKKIQHVTWP
ncbi:ashwin isoform X1 [Dermochelys coriacea]|uniref:ashwin isoform X1 n=1 Tax=Dermochelys coriacea TaxID=27794 RepID=UPI001CAA0117|nr:ashwin isoform X1 [Dermochelys coriacea]